MSKKLHALESKIGRDARILELIPYLHVQRHNSTSDAGTKKTKTNVELRGVPRAVLLDALTLEKSCPVCSHLYNPVRLRAEERARLDAGASHGGAYVAVSCKNPDLPPHSCRNGDSGREYDRLVVDLETLKTLDAHGVLPRSPRVDEDLGRPEDELSLEEMIKELEESQLPPLKLVAQ